MPSGNPAIATLGIGSATQFRPGHNGFRPGTRQNVIRELSELQAALHTDGIKDETPAAAKAQATRAYVEAEKLKLLLRGHGAPKPVPARNDPTTKPRARKSKVEPVE